MYQLESYYPRLDVTIVNRRALLRHIHLHDIELEITKMKINDLHICIEP